MSVAAFAQWLADRRTNLRGVGLVVAVLLFGGGLVLALGETPELFERLEAGPFILLVLLGAPIVTALNTIEFQMIARYGGSRISSRAALETTIYARVANMLPLPGAMMTRIAALKLHGTGYTLGLVLVVLSSAMWGSMTSIYSGLWMLTTSDPKIAAIFVGVGLVGAVACSVIAWRITPDWRLTAGIFTIRLVGLPLTAVRVMLAMWTVGGDIGFAEASVYVVAAFIGTAAVIVPAGLGVSEAAMALMSPLIGIDPATGFLMGVVARIGLMSGFLILVLLLALMQRLQSQSA